MPWFFLLDAVAISVMMASTLRVFLATEFIADRRIEIVVQGEFDRRRLFPVAACF